MRLKKHLLVVFVVPVVTVLLSLMYRPFNMFELLDIGVFQPQTHIILLGAVFVLCLLVSRTFYALVELKHPLEWRGDLVWSLSETVASAFLLGLYLSLISSKPYFHCAGNALELTAAIAILPYSILFQLRRREKNTVPESAGIIRFCDENQRLRLAVAESSVLYIKAENNSVRVFYLDGERVKDCSFRISMLKLSPLAEKHRLVRCQRSYFVNPSRVRALRKDKDGFFFAEMGIPGLSPIPVSKTYYPNLASLL